MDYDLTLPWNSDLQGRDILPLINDDVEIIRVDAGPGTGKTTGLVRRVQRILHPDGLNVSGKDVLIVAFNRVIAKQLKKDVEKRLKDSPHDGEPVILTVHALCLDVIGDPMRLLLPHERDAMLYDVLEIAQPLSMRYHTHAIAEQALSNHEAKHETHLELWQEVQRWIARHSAQLLSELPAIFLDRLRGGDFGDRTYRHVIVDEFQDLTAGEQELFIRLAGANGRFVALGDPRQSIYRFRGNDAEGLKKLESYLGPDRVITNVPLNTCHRCPSTIVSAANGLMSHFPRLESTSTTQANVHLVTWGTPQEEAEGMAPHIIRNILAYRGERHLVMVTRRQFGFWLRDAIRKLDPSIRVDLSFSESILDTWTVREAFLFLSLIGSPDAPTWRAWLGYQDPISRKTYKASKRNAPAYLSFLTQCKDKISEADVVALASASKAPPGDGGKNLLERAKRYVELKTRIGWDGVDPEVLLKNVLTPIHWYQGKGEEEAGTVDLDVLLKHSLALLAEDAGRPTEQTTTMRLERLIRRLRYEIATREPFEGEAEGDVQVATLWGAKGTTAEHVYILGLCNEAIPGRRREEYPGTDVDYLEEQRRLFYVSLTRSKRTLVLSRPLRIKSGDAARLNLSVSGWYWSNLSMSTFMRDIGSMLPIAVPGGKWVGCT